MPLCVLALSFAFVSFFFCASSAPVVDGVRPRAVADHRDSFHRDRPVYYCRIVPPRPPPLLVIVTTTLHSHLRIDLPPRTVARCKSIPIAVSSSAPVVFCSRFPSVVSSCFLGVLCCGSWLPHVPSRTHSLARSLCLVSSWSPRRFAAAVFATVRAPCTLALPSQTLLLLPLQVISPHLCWSLCSR